MWFEVQKVGYANTLSFLVSLSSLKHHSQPAGMIVASSSLWLSSVSVDVVDYHVGVYCVPLLTIVLYTCRAIQCIYCHSMDAQQSGREV